MTPTYALRRAGARLRPDDRAGENTDDPGGTFEPRKNLGRHAFPHDPEVGFMIEIDGEQYDVTEVYLGFCHVRPANVAYRTHVRYRER
jgi:hypothetical protein